MPNAHLLLLTHTPTYYCLPPATSCNTRSPFGYSTQSNSVPFVHPFFLTFVFGTTTQKEFLDICSLILLTTPILFLCPPLLLNLGEIKPRRDCRTIGFSYWILILLPNTYFCQYLLLSLLPSLLPNILSFYCLFLIYS